MLDPKPGIMGLRHSLQGGRVSVKHQRIAAIADGMSGDLPAIPQGRHGRCLQDLGVDQQESLARRLVMIRLEQQGAPRSHGAVDEDLDGPQFESVSRRGFARRPADEFDLVSRRQGGHGIDPQTKLARAVEITINLGHGRGDAGIVNTGQARREDLLLRSQDSPLQIVGLGRRNDPRHESHRPIHEDAGGLTVRIAEDLSVGGSHGLPADAGLAHGLGIGPSRVPIHPSEPDRPAGRDRIEHGGGGKGTAWPEALVPASPRDPGVAGNGLDPRLHAPGNLVQRAHPAKIDPLEAGPERLNMPVSVDQAGHCERPGAVDHDGPRMLEAQHVFPAANLHNRAIACSHALGPGIRGIAGPDAARQDDQVGRPFGLQAQGPVGPRQVPGDPDHGSSVTPIELPCSTRSNGP